MGALGRHLALNLNMRIPKNLKNFWRRNMDFLAAFILGFFAGVAFHAVYSFFFRDRFY